MTAEKNSYYTNLRYDLITTISVYSSQYKTILEIGGGGFPTLNYLKKKYDARVYGLDIYKTDNQEINFIHGSVEDSKTLDHLENGLFDLIILGDVVEHLLQPSMVLGHLRSKLSDTGIMVLSIPNIRQIKSFYYIQIKGTFPRHVAGLFDKTHLRWFCKKDMVDMLYKEGYEILYVRPNGRFINRMTRFLCLSEFLALQFIFIVKPKCL